MKIPYWAFGMALIVTLSFSSNSRSQTARNTPQIVVIAIPGATGNADATKVDPPVNAEQVATLYTMACQQVAETLHIKDSKRLEYPVTLVLGQEVERYTIDHQTGAATVYLQQWDEVHFVASAVMISVHHALPDEQFQTVVLKTLKRFRNASPVTVSELRAPLKTPRHP